MAIAVSATLCVVIPLLLIEAVYADSIYAGDYDDGAKAGPTAIPTKPLSWEELQVTSLQEINVVAQKIPKAMEEGNENCPYLAAMRDIRPLRNSAEVQNVLNRALEINPGGIFKSKVDATKELLCGVAERFRKQLKAVIALAKVVATSPRSEFLEIVKNENFSEKDNIFNKAVHILSGNVGNKQLQLNVQAAARQVNTARFSPKLGGQKLAAFKRIRTMRIQFGTELKSITDAANYVLNTLHDAMLASKDIQQELRSTHGYPHNIVAEEAKLKRALALNRELGCSKPKASSWVQSTSFVVEDDDKDHDYGMHGPMEGPDVDDDDSSRTYPTVPNPTAATRFEFIPEPTPERRSSLRSSSSSLPTVSLSPSPGVPYGRWRSPSRNYGR